MAEDDWTEAEEKRNVLRNVAAYRALCKQVRKKANWGLGFGAFMLGIWFMLYGQRQDYGVFSMIYLGLAGLEFSAGVLNKLRPSAEGVLIDGFVLFGFGAANFGRTYLSWQAGKNPDLWMLGFGAYWIFAGFSAVRSYAVLRRAFSVRPTGDHLRWFDGLIREVRGADPETDDNALDLPTRPPIRGKLLDDTAIFLVAGSDDPLILAREDVEIERQPARRADRGLDGFLLLANRDFGGFPLDPDNWRNYAAWKTEGGEPPPPMTVLPADER